tara:strand:- start:189 stop:674 length:486 start_codon:yes stop_codon:yes gene_type:complete
MSINDYLNEIISGNIDKVKNYETNLINEIGKINPRGYDLIPLFAALNLLIQDKEKGEEMIEYLLSIPNLNISKKVVHVNGGDWTNEIFTTFHILSSDNISREVCENILNHSSFDLEALNTIDHDDYRPLDLADEYNPDIVELLENKGALRHWRVGPGFKPK